MSKSAIGVLSPHPGRRQGLPGRERPRTRSPAPTAPDERAFELRVDRVFDVSAGSRRRRWTDQDPRRRRGGWRRVRRGKGVGATRSSIRRRGRCRPRGRARAKASVDLYSRAAQRSRKAEVVEDLPGHGLGGDRRDHLEATGHTGRAAKRVDLVDAREQRGPGGATAGGHRRFVHRKGGRRRLERGLLGDDERAIRRGRREDTVVPELMLPRRRDRYDLSATFRSERCREPRRCLRPRVAAELIGLPGSSSRSRPCWPAWAALRLRGCTDPDRSPRTSAGRRR